MKPLAAALVAVAVVVALLAWVRATIGDVLTAGGAPVAQRALAGAGGGAPVRGGPVRVVVLDGLTRADAHGPALDALCARGLDLVVDVGFPTKSLPVQSVLWSGRTAQESGVAMRNALPGPIAGALPARVPGSIAIVEAWPSIARAVGFASVVPTEVTDAWRAAFPAAARAAVTGPSPLVMIHVLAIDEAGHRGGRDARYRAEVARADALLGELLAAAPDAHWLVLADHGHLRGGGHGDAESVLRLVRACVAPRPPGAPAAGPAHLVDVARHLHDALGVGPTGVGRPLAIAVSAPDPDATLPRPPPWAWPVAALLALAGLGLGAGCGRPRWVAAWPFAALGLHVAVAGLPTLSARGPWLAAACGLVAAVAVLVPRGRSHPGRVTAMVGPGLGVVLAAAVLAGLPAALAGGPPARLPFVTAALEVVACAVAPMVLAAAALAGWHLARRPVPVDES